MQNLTNMQMPEGVLGAMYAGSQAAQADILNQIEAGTNLEKLHRDQQMNPLDIMVRQKEAAFAQDEMNNPALRDWRMKGMIGKDKTSAAQGDYDQATYQDKLKAGLAEYAAKVPKAQLEKEMAEGAMALKALTTIEALGGKTGFDQLDFLTQATQIAKQIGAPDEVIQTFAQAQPAQRAEMLSKIKDGIKRGLTETAAHLQNLAVEDRKGEWDVKKANIMANGQIGAANAGAKSIEAQNKKQLVAQITVYQSELAKLAPKLQEMSSDPVLSSKIKRRIVAETGKAPTPSEIEKAVANEVAQSAMGQEYTAIRRQLEVLKKSVDYPEVPEEKPKVTPSGVSYTIEKE